MRYLFIDESGSMTTEHSKHYPYFIITVVAIKENDKARRVYKRFVSKNINALKAGDIKNRIFNGDKFVELKGNSMEEKLKIEFLDYFCKNQLLEVYYIKINNRKVRYDFYKNISRAFNYILKEALRCELKENNLPKDEYYLNIDERNEKAKTKHFLEEYLSVQFTLEENLVNRICVDYFDSSKNALVQLADVFSNIYYSYCLTGKFEDKLTYLRESGYIKDIYLFP